MDHSQTVPSLVLMTSLLGLFMGPTGCSRPAEQQEMQPDPGGFSRYPAADMTTVTDLDTEVPENPWLSGFGGATQAATEPHGDPMAFGDEPRTPSDSPVDPPVDHPVDSVSDPLPPAEAPGPLGSGGSADEQEPEPLLARRLQRYLEGEGADKLLGISGQAGISPAPCRIEIYSNGGTSPWRTIPLPDEFPENGMLTLCSIPENHPECTVTMSGSLYNGNDALVLWCGEVVMDAFGRVGEDPGAAWTSTDETLRSEGQDLVRCFGASRTDPFELFELSSEWIRIENGESPEEASQRCSPLEALGEGGAAAFTL